MGGGRCRRQCREVTTAVPVDRLVLLDWMVVRERAEQGLRINGRDLMARASTLCAGDPRPSAAVARAAGELHSLGCVTWRYVLYPGDTSEPPPHLINYRNLQQVEDVMVTPTGYRLIADRHPPGPGTQITISGSQVAFGNIQNIDIFVLLDATESQIDQMDAPQEVKDEARGIVRRMREAGVGVGSSAVGSVIAAAIRQALGLP
jgi:hypothetical protein